MMPQSIQDDLPRARRSRLPAAGLLLAVVLAAAAWHLAAVPHPPAAAQAGAVPWSRSLDGLYGDRVASVAFIGLGGLNGLPMLLVSQDRGLFRSQDDLSGWDPVVVTPTRPSEVVQTVVRVLADPDGKTFVAGLRGQPMFARTEDRGKTWTTYTGPTGGQVPTRFDLMAVSNGISNTIYAAEASSPTQRFWVSSDKGKTWSSYRSPQTGAAITSIFTAPDDASIYMIAGDTLYRTSDNPEGWTPVLGPASVRPMRVRLAAAGPRGRLHATGESDGLYTVLTSTNRGDSWPSSGGWPGDIGDRPRALAAAEVIEAVSSIWIGLSNGRIFQSDNGGSSWNKVLEIPVSPTLIAVDTVAKHVWVGTDGLGLYQAGPSPLHLGAVSVEALAVAAPTFADDKLAMVLAQVQRAGRDENGQPRPALFGLFDSTGGDMWNRRMLTTLPLGNNLLASPNFATDHTLYSGRYVSADGGYTWNPVAISNVGAPPYVSAIGPITGTTPVLYALDTPYDANGAGGSGLSLSENGGASWQATDVAVSGIVAVAISPDYVDNRRAFFATDRGRIFRSVDGVSFEEVSQLPAVAPERIVYDLAVSPNFRRDSLLMAAVDVQSAPQHAQLYVSTNGGNSWNLQNSGLLSIGHPRALAISPQFQTDRQAFVGTETRASEPTQPGIYGTDSAANEWYGEVLLPPAAVNGFAFGGVGPGGRLFAAIGTAGVWWRDLALRPGPVLPTPTATATSGTLRTPTPTASPTRTPVATRTPTGTLTPPTATPVSPTPTPSPTATDSPAGTPSPSATLTPPTPSATVTPTRTATASPTATATSTPTASPTRTPAQPRAIYIPYAVKKFRLRGR